MGLVIPKNNADESTLDATLKVYFDANGWVENQELIDKLSSALIDSGIEPYKKEPQSYTKKTQVPAYFGFIEWKDPENEQSPRHITELGKRFYEARISGNKKESIAILIEALSKNTFGRNVLGCSSDSDLEAPNIFIKSSLLLDGLSNKEFAFILGKMELYNYEFGDAIFQLKMLRQTGETVVPDNDAKKWGDPKPITALKNWGFFVDNNKIAPEVISDYAINLLSLRTKNTEPIRFKSINQSDSESDETKTYNKYRQYITAIKSKPFLLLAGISGTGKSRIVRELARACWEEGSEEYKAQKPKNFEMIQVKPNWHDSSELIGYVSRINGETYVVGPFLKFMVKAIQNPEMPYFLCLDEMNLAPVEQYFAEYLSIIESRKKNDFDEIKTDPIVDYDDTDAYKSLIDQLFTVNDDERALYLTEDVTIGKRLSLPSNLVVVGTVNMDETTFSFSRKVLDRAMTIEMNGVDLYSGLSSRFEKIGKLGNAELVGDAVEGVDVYEEHKDVCDIVLEYLESVNDVLSNTPFKIAYRTRNEFLLYVVNNLPYNKDVESNDIAESVVIARALDEITSMKILSRIEGDDTKVSKSLLDKLSDTISEGLNAIASDENTYVSAVSLPKLEEMKTRLESGYTSFWS